ncbi:hypothetical protein I547_3075 [Mycobacterium kansasii 824]|nr:hypothetical protein I547_3075 [Mycobacterium kansasii 824]
MTRLVTGHTLLRRPTASGKRGFAWGSVAANCVQKYSGRPSPTAGGRSGVA